MPEQCDVTSMLGGMFAMVKSGRKILNLDI